MQPSNSSFFIIFTFVLGLNLNCTHEQNVHLDKITVRALHPNNDNAKQFIYANQLESQFDVFYFGPKKDVIEIDNFYSMSQRDIESYIEKAQNFKHGNILFTLQRSLPKP